jgi:hypothetical protein
MSLTRADIVHLAQVLISVKALVPDKVPQDEFDRLIDRMLWAIHSSTGNPKFDERRFRDHANGAPDPIFLGGPQ